MTDNSRGIPDPQPAHQSTPSPSTPGPSTPGPSTPGPSAPHPSPPGRERPADRLPSVLRFATELVAWVATPWALAGVSWGLAALSVVVLIGLPTVFATPGDKSSVVVAVPGAVTVLLVVLQLAAAVVSAWCAWPAWAAVAVSVLAGAAVVTELPRWRWLFTL